MSKNPKAWIRANDAYPNESSPEEIINAINMFIEERLYIPLTLYMSNEFASYHGDALIRRILIDVLLSQWNENTCDIAIEAMKKSIAEYSEERNNFTDN